MGNSLNMKKLVCYFCTFLTFRSPSTETLLDCFGFAFRLKRRLFQSILTYHYQLLLQLQLFILLTNSFLKKTSNHQTVTWRCQFESLPVKNICSGISMPYYGYTVFWDAKIVEAARVWGSGAKLPRKGIIFTFGKSLKQAKSFLK